MPVSRSATAFPGPPRPATGDVDTDGFLGGGFAGYNLQNGLFVYGIEADVGYTGVKGDNGITETKSGVEGSLRGRLGFAVTDDILLYATAGGAAKRLEGQRSGGDDSNTMLGWTAGAAST